jgi:hypothetical protein
MLSSPFVAFDAFWIVLAGLLVSIAQITARLRRNHPQVWEEFGRPSLLPRRRIGASAALTRLYWSRRIATLEDPALRHWVYALRTLQVLLAIVLGVLWNTFIATGTIHASLLAG